MNKPLILTWLLGLTSLRGESVVMFLSCMILMVVICFPGRPSSPTLSCIDLSENINGIINVTVSWTLIGINSPDFYIIDITTNAPTTPYGGILNITIASVTQHELTGFMAGYEYNITVLGVVEKCGGLVGNESEPLKITPQGTSLQLSMAIETCLIV